MVIHYIACLQCTPIMTIGDEGLLQKFARLRLPPIIVSTVVTVVTQPPTCSPAVVPHIKFINPFSCHVHSVSV